MVEKIDIKEMINKRKARGMILLEEGFEPKNQPVFLPQLCKQHLFYFPQSFGQCVQDAHTTRIEYFIPHTHIFGSLRSP